MLTVNVFLLYVNPWFCFRKSKRTISIKKGEQFQRLPFQQSKITYWNVSLCIIRERILFLNELKTHFTLNYGFRIVRHFAEVKKMSSHTALLNVMKIYSSWSKIFSLPYILYLDNKKNVGHQIDFTPNIDKNLDIISLCSF